MHIPVIANIPRILSRHVLFVQRGVFTLSFRSKLNVLSMAITTPTTTPASCDKLDKSAYLSFASLIISNVG